MFYNEQFADMLKITVFPCYADQKLYLAEILFITKCICHCKLAVYKHTFQETGCSFSLHCMMTAQPRLTWKLPPPWEVSNGSFLLALVELRK